MGWSDRDWDDYVKGTGWWGWWRREWERGPVGAGGTGGDAWTAIVGLLLAGVALLVAFYIAMAIHTVYLWGASVYFYAVEVRGREATALAVCLVVLLVLQVLQFLVLFRRRRLVDVLAYLIILPPLNLFALGIGLFVLGLVPDTGPWLVAVSAGLPRAGMLSTGIPAGDVADMLPVGLTGLALFLLALEALRHVILCCMKYVIPYGLYFVSRVLRRAGAGIERAAGSLQGRLLLGLLGVLALALSARVATPWLTLPWGFPGFAVVLLGALFGWRLAAMTVVAWLLIGLAGLPALAPEVAIDPRSMIGIGTGTVLAAMLAGLCRRTSRFGQVWIVSLTANALIWAGYLAGVVAAFLSLGWPIDPGYMWHVSVLPWLVGLLAHSGVAAVLFHAGRRLRADAVMPAGAIA